MPDWGFKISQDGFDVTTCTDDQLVMSSEFNMVKTKASSTKTGTGDLSTAHGLAYIPMCFVIKKKDTNKYTILGGCPFSVDSTNLVIQADASTTEYFRYYIFYQQGK